MKFARLWNRVFNAVEDFDKPVIAAVQGHCLAGGLELVLCCDFAVAAEDANLADHHSKFNLLPGAGSSQRLPRLLGLPLAKYLLYTGRSVSGAEAARLGIVCKAVPGAELMQTVTDLANELAAKPADLLPALKKIVNRGINGELHAGLELEIQALYGSLLSATRSGGMTNFRDRKA
jgi:enoyl-CoA hydratase/carnithine racemase